MKSYYHVHESGYQEIKAQGFVGWGNAKNLAELGDIKTNTYLNQKIQKYFPEAAERTALDLGCGTGTTAFLLAKHGFQTTGIDVSETAIAMGWELSEQQGLSIEFICGDVLNLRALSQRFDFIYDSHLLHCIVFDEDRKKVFSEVKSVLNTSGVFILDTMVIPDGAFDSTKMFGELRFDQEFILWHKTGPTSVRGVIEVDGQYWCAQRRIYPAANVKNEVLEAGFRIIEEQLDIQEGSPSMLRMVLEAVQ